MPPSPPSTSLISRTRSTMKKMGIVAYSASAAAVRASSRMSTLMRKPPDRLPESALAVFGYVGVAPHRPHAAHRGRWPGVAAEKHQECVALLRVQPVRVGREQVAHLPPPSGQDHARPSLLRPAD